MERNFSPEELEHFKTLVREFSPRVAFRMMLEFAPRLQLMMGMDKFRRAFWKHVTSWHKPDLEKAKRAQDKACQKERKAADTRQGPYSRFCNDDWTDDEDKALLALVEEHRDKRALFIKQGLSNKKWREVVPLFNASCGESGTKRTACGMRNRYIKLRMQRQKTQRQKSTKRAQTRNPKRVQCFSLLLSPQPDDDLLEECEDVDALPESREIEVDNYIEQNDDDTGIVPTTTVVNLSAADEEWLVDHHTNDDAFVQALHVELGLPKLDSNAHEMPVFSDLL
jgi:hypothetical protein